MIGGSVRADLPDGLCHHPLRLREAAESVSIDVAGRLRPEPRLEVLERDETVHTGLLSRVRSLGGLPGQQDKHVRDRGTNPGTPLRVDQECGSLHGPAAHGQRVGSGAGLAIADTMRVL